MVKCILGLESFFVCGFFLWVWMCRYVRFFWCRVMRCLKVFRYGLSVVIVLLFWVIFIVSLFLVLVIMLFWICMLNLLIFVVVFVLVGVVGVRGFVMLIVCDSVVLMFFCLVKFVYIWYVLVVFYVYGSDYVLVVVFSLGWMCWYVVLLLCIMMRWSCLLCVVL